MNSASQSFAAQRQNKFQLVFCRDMCVGENSSRLTNVGVLLALGAALSCSACSRRAASFRAAHDGSALLYKNTKPPAVLLRDWGLTPDSVFPMDCYLLSSFCFGYPPELSRFPFLQTPDLTDRFLRNTLLLYDLRSHAYSSLFGTNQVYTSLCVSQ